MQRGAEHQGLEPAGQRHGQDQRQRGALTADLTLEGCAARAAIDVGARNAPGQDSAPRRCQPLADLRARMLPRPPSTHQRLTRLEDQRLHLLLAHPEHGGDFFVRLIPELEENERGALVGRQPLHVIQHLAKVLPPLDLICHAVEGWSIGRQRRRYRGRGGCGAQTGSDCARSYTAMAEAKCRARRCATRETPRRTSAEAHPRPPRGFPACARRTRARRVRIDRRSPRTQHRRPHASRATSCSSVSPTTVPRWNPSRNPATAAFTPMRTVSST